MERAEAAQKLPDAHGALMAPGQAGSYVGALMQVRLVGRCAGGFDEWGSCGRHGAAAAQVLSEGLPCAQGISRCAQGMRASRQHVSEPLEVSLSSWGFCKIGAVVADWAPACWLQCIVWALHLLLSGI